MKTRVLYVVSQFPKVTETFVVNEWLALSDRFEMHLAALRHAEAGVGNDAPPRVMERAQFPPRWSSAAFTAHLHWLRRMPRQYAQTLFALVRGLRHGPSSHRALAAAKTVIAFHQAVGLARTVEALGVDHVHAHFANHPATSAWVVHRLTARPFSFTAHANDLYRASDLLVTKALEAAFVVAISEYNAQLLQRRAPGSRVRVVHCGVDTCRFTPGTEPAGPITLGTILCVAGLQAKKGHRDLVESFARLAAERSSLHLMLVGEGPERAAIETAVKSLDLQDRVTLAGARSPNEIVDALHEAALFVLAAVCDDTGRMDGIPVALMEAMAAGVPVVTTSVSGIPELVSDGETGLVVEPGDPPALANAMAKLLDDDALRAHVRIAARAWVARDFDLYVEAAKLGELIDEAVAARA